MLRKLLYKQNNVILRNYFSLLLVQITNVILPLITFPYLVRVLGVKLYGTVMMAYSLAIFFGIFVDFGFNITATREVALLRKDKILLSKYFSNVLTIRTILLFFSFFLLLILTHSIQKLSENIEVYLFSFGIVIGQAIFPSWFFQGIEKMKTITIINFISKLIFTISIFLFIKNESDYLLASLFYSLGSIISGFIGIILCLKFIKAFKPSIKQMKIIFLESFSVFTSNIFVSFYTTLNTLILGVFTTESLAGVYVSIEKIIVAIKSVYTPLYQAIFPNITVRSKNDVISFIKKILFPIILSSFLITSIIFVFSEEILSLIFNDLTITEYAYILKILSIITVFSSLSMMYITLLLPSFKQYIKRLKILTFVGFINIIIIIPLIKLFSITGVAFSATFTELILFIISLIGLKKFSQDSK